MKSFLYHVLKNLIVDHYRKHQAVSLDVLMEKGFVPSADCIEHISDMFDGSIAMSFINRLPKKYERVIRLRYVKHLSLKEVAVETKQSENTTAVQVHRGLSMLRSLVDPIMPIDKKQGRSISKVKSR